MTEEHKVQSKRHYAVLSHESIQAYAEAGGHANLSSDLAAMLSEDVIYRLREVIQTSCQFARHAKRIKLTTEDFNKALRQSDVQPVLGHGASENIKWRQTKEGELHFVEDMDISLANLACSSQAPIQPGSTSIRAHWLAVEGAQKGPLLGPNAPDQQGNQTKNVSPELLEYHDHITKAILGNNQELLSVALSDLRTNPRITPLLPHLISFIANGVKKLCHDASQLTKLLATIRSLQLNQSLFLQPKPYMFLLVDSVLVCLLEPLTASIHPLHDHWLLRDMAARLLANLVHEWATATNKLTEQVTVRLRSVLYNSAKPFSSQYGAISALLALGLQTFEEVVFSYLGTYWPHLQSALNDTSMSNTLIKRDACKVRGILLMGTEYLLLSKRSFLIHNIMKQKQEGKQLSNKQGQVDTGQGHSSTSRVSRINDSSSSDRRGPPYYIAYEIFGDSLSVRLPCSPVDIYTQQEAETSISLKDESYKKTGEELLEQFLDVAGSSHARQRSRGLDGDEYDMRSYGPSPDELDYEGDEKSEHSSRSEHSDNLSFMDEDVADLTVKATVNDPSKGIKLFIAKKPKSKSSEVESLDSGSEHKGTPPLILTPRRPKPKLEDVFDINHGSKRDTTFVFRYAGRLHRCMIERRKSTLIDSLPPSPVPESVHVTANYHGQKLFGKHSAVGVKSKRKCQMFLTCDYFF